MRAFRVRLPDGVAYWTVLDDELAVVGEADAFLRQVRFGEDRAELTTKAYAGAVALYLAWCRRTGRDWRSAAPFIGMFMTWLRHVPRDSGTSGGGEVLLGPGGDPVRGARRVNVVLSAVRRFLLHGVAAGLVPAEIVPALYEVSDNRDLPAAARPEDGLMLSRLRARHRLREPERPWTGRATRRSSPW